jgi:predicted glutamine amidotransferase
MCKLLLGIKLNNSDTREFGKILKLQEKILRTEPDGIAGIRIRKDDKVSTIKRLENYNPVFDDIYRHIAESKIISIHTRQATSGAVDLENTHYFRVNEYFFAHNGIVGDCFDYPRKGFWKEPETSDINLEQETDLSDSYRFLIDLPKPITKNVLEKAIKEKSFVGFGVLIDTKRKKIFILTTRVLEAHTDFRNYFFVYSFTPKSVVRRYKNFIGLRLFDQSKDERLKSFSIEEGIYEMKFNARVGLKKEMSETSDL